jgi:aminomethyltransferase
MTDASAPIRQTPLHAAHVALGARMVPFAGYDMPVQYPTGILAEHQQTRTLAGLFDVSHMGQASLVGPDHETVARALEALCPADVLGLPPGRQRYSQLTTATGGIIDDFMVTRPAREEAAGRLQLVLNAGRKDVDCAHIAAHLPDGVRLERHEDRALLALQGPKAALTLGRLSPGVCAFAFMGSADCRIGGLAGHVSRSGYTGEDGFEISVAATDAGALWDLLLAQPDVAPIGLGARDSLRLEAGLCLYGHDIDETTTPVEAGLGWSIAKRRRIEGGFPGAERILNELSAGPSRKRVGFRLDGRAPAREGAVVTDPRGGEIGRVTSGGFGPSLDAPIAMGYVPADLAAPGTGVELVVRGRGLPARVARLPFFPHRYHR